MYEKKIQVKHAHTSTNGILINAKEKKNNFKLTIYYSVRFKVPINWVLLSY